MSKSIVQVEIERKHDRLQENIFFKGAKTMSRAGSNKLLHVAKKSKNDEFYTQLTDIESELEYYGEHFRGKIVYCNCDDPRASNFFKYFFQNFKKLGITKLIAACYKEQSSDLFNTNENEQAFYFVYTGEEGDINQLIDEKSVPFKLDGDFRSEESKALLDQCDIVVTNPPFSLFREYVEQLVKNRKKFLIIGNINAITYKEIFKLIKQDKAWLGVKLGRGISGFIVPDHYELYGTEARIDDNGKRIVSPNNCLWLTNLDHCKRHEIINLTKCYSGNEAEYPKYDNYDGVNVNKTKNIPYDYAGAIGVPITFLHKYNPEQFELIKFRKGNNERDLSINGKCPYFRILVRNKHYVSSQIQNSQTPLSASKLTA